MSGAIDGRSGGLTRLAWGSGPEETLRASNEHRPVSGVRVAALVNLEGMPAGLEVDVALKRPGEGYDYSPTTVLTHITRSKEIAALAVFPRGLDPVDGVQFVFRDAGGLVAEGTQFSLGEVVYGAAADFGLDPRWEITPAESQSESARISSRGQVYLNASPAARRISASIPPTAYQRAVTDSDSLQTLMMSLAQDPRCLVIADPDTQAIAESTWLYGWARSQDPLRFNERSRRATVRFHFQEMVGRAA